MTSLLWFALVASTLLTLVAVAMTAGDDDKITRS
jgi:hypothetical protein